MNTITSKVIYFLIISIILVASCGKDHDPDPIDAPPTITSFSPSSVTAGATVVITGTNFTSGNNSANEVKINGAVAPVTAATSTQLTIIVPNTATSGKITITISGILITSTDDLQISNGQIPTPTISSFSPLRAAIGATVVITGTNFITGNNKANNVTINGVAATVTAATDTQLTITVPNGATTGKISVNTGGSIATSPYDLQVTNDNVPVPTITSFAPLSTTQGGTVVITGTNFITGSTTVKVNGTVATITASTTTQLTITVPFATTGKVTVDNGNSTVATSADDLQISIDIPRNGLVAFYPFNGNANDISGNNLNGTLSTRPGDDSNIPVPAADRFGNANNCYYFDGTGYIELGNPSKLQITNKITLAAWFSSADTDDSNTTRVILSKMYRDPARGNNPGGGFDFEHYGSRVVFSQLNVNPTNDTHLSQVYADCKMNTWIFVAIVIDGTNYSIYVNGQLKNKVPYPQSVFDVTLANFEIGAESQYYNFNGLIDDVAIYNTALTDAEVLQLYQQTVTSK